MLLTHTDIRFIGPLWSDSYTPTNENGRKHLLALRDLDVKWRSLTKRRNGGPFSPTMARLILPTL